MLAGAAALLVVPFPLVDGVAVIPARVGHIVHLRPHEDAIVGVDLTVRISGRVGRVGLHHLAVALHHFALVWVLHAPEPSFKEQVVVLCDGRS